MDSYYVVTFHSVSQALAFEKKMLADGGDIRMIPVPRIISSSCGIAARIASDSLAAARKHLTDVPGTAESIYCFSVEGKKIHAERLSGPWSAGE